MKKFISCVSIMIMAMFSMVSASAQTVESSRFFDNWSVGLKGGVTTPLSHSAFWGDMRPVVGVELTKAVTPILSLGIEGVWSVNTSNVHGISNKLAFDRQFVGSLTKVNLMNAFGGFIGTPRVFEIELVGGIGWLHEHMHGNTDPNSWYTKWGANFNFNLGENKAWTLAFKPDVVFDMGGINPGFNRNKASLELMAGVTYHFKNHNGTHSFNLCDKLYTQEEWEDLNCQINSLREQLEECKNRPAEVIETVIIKEVKCTEEVCVVPEFPKIKFEVNSSTVSAENKKVLAEIANSLKNTTDDILVNGFASEEGAADFNQTLSLKRAEAVKAILIDNGIAAERITAVGNGATTKFGKTHSDNRIVITTI